jgi:hypothetical protein
LKSRMMKKVIRNLKRPIRKLKRPRKSNKLKSLIISMV